MEGIQIIRAKTKIMTESIGKRQREGDEKRPRER